MIRRVSIILFLLFYLSGAREMLLRRACMRNPSLAFCQRFRAAPSIEEKKNIFVEWARVAARDSADIEDLEIEELETSRKRPGNIDEYCSKYNANYKNYCSPAKARQLESLLAQFCASYKKNCDIDEADEPKDDAFPTPAPILPAKPVAGVPPLPSKGTKVPHKATQEEKLSRDEYCDKFRDEYHDQCKNTHVNDFCDSFTKLCKLETSEPVSKKDGGEKQMPNDGKGKEEEDIDDDLEDIEKETNKIEDTVKEKNPKKPPKEDDDDDEDNLESLEEYETTEQTPTSPEGEGASNDEVQQYCQNYSENYNFYCVGDMSPEHEKFCTSYKKNCPNSAPMQLQLVLICSFLSIAPIESRKRRRFKESGSFLGKNGDEQSGGGDRSLYLYKGNKKEYCDKFGVNYNYYCKGTIENVEIFTKFCPSYKKACLGDGETTASTGPANPFSKETGIHPSAKEPGGDSDFPDILNPGSSSSSSSSGPSKPKIKKRECTPDCDQRIFRHCTVECKCDYIYPAVQKFCNPPPMPLFLNTCRLWYNGCPKYEQYHYASQFVYSKAEKGKVLEGPKTSTTFQLLTPNGQTLPYKPSRWRRSAEPMMTEWPETMSDEPANGVEWMPKKSELVAAPPLPKNHIAKDDAGAKSTKGNSLEEGPDLPRIKKTTGGQSVPVFSDSVFSNALQQYNTFTDSRGILHRPRSRSPFTKPGLWEPNPDDPHNRDHANKWYYHPRSVGVDWLQGQLTWGAHWAVPAAGTGGTDGFSALHFPSLGTFFNIPDDYD